MTESTHRRLHVELNGMLSSELVVSEGPEVLARLKGSAWSQEVQASVGGRSFTLKANWTGGKIELRDTQDDRVVAQAQKASMLSMRYRVLPLGRAEDAEGGPEFTVDCRPMARKYRLLLGDEEVGALRYKGLLGRRMELDVPPRMPLELIVLAVYISRTVRRQTSGDA
ncbi:MAG: hypothetical protein ACYS26_01335 [Planctomycetota bacterium]|jgi:hypothetical protein